MTYWICSACGDGSQFKDKKAFVEHLKSSHTATILPDQIPILVDLSEKNTPAEMPRCPLCSWPEEGLEVDKDALLNHIAREIHAFSLRALPWADNNGQESDERIHASSEKVFKWLVDNGLQTNLGIERPSREDRIWHSEYFQQDAYFAGSSHAASSSQSAFDSSRENELDELRREGELTIHEGCDSSGLASHGPETEKDLEPGAGFAKIGLKKYAVGWVCAIRSEYVAAQVFMDDVHERPSNIPPHDTNEYTFGEMGNHNVVIAVLPMGGYGSNSAAIVAIEMARSFPELRLILMVGIGGGAPSSKHDIRLGDVVVGASGDGQSGLLQYDTGRIIPDGGFQQTGYFGPPIPLRNAVHGLAAQYEMDGHNIQEAIAEVLNRKPRLRRKYGIPDLTTDRLYKSDFVHQYDSDGNSPCAISCGDDPSSLVIRSDRSEREDEPTIHYGLIASGNTLMRDARTRDKLTAAKDVLCFEMEAAGLVNRMPCLVIRGICDYADSHKSNEWQGYAAMVAAAYAKDLLKHIPLHQVEQEPKISAVLTVIDHDYPTNIGSKHTSIEFTGNNSGVKIGQNKGQISY